MFDWTFLRSGRCLSIPHLQHPPSTTRLCAGMCGSLHLINLVLIIIIYLFILTTADRQMGLVCVIF